MKASPAMPTETELRHFLRAETLPYRLREDVDLEHVHWATTRARPQDELIVLAMDHRVQFEELARELGADPSRVPAFKTLALRAVEAAAGGDRAFGVLLDGRYGFDALAEAADHPYWIGRPIELPRSRPLAFECSPDVATELNEWPLNHVVKCLVLYHPDDESALREQQERQLRRLFDACRKTRHELLVEVILPPELDADATTVARAIRRLYAIGVRPDWWKLEPASDPRAWREIEAAVVDGDPLCRGVLVLGLSAPEAELIESFAAAAPFAVVKGFAVGRTIFYDAARDWFAGRLDSDGAVRAMTDKLKRLADAWRRARAAQESAA
jgi:5-dehydro-2-deoxygluconokinase